MGRYFALTLGMQAQPQTKIKPKRAALSPKINFGFWVLFLILALGAAYLFSVNDTATKGYQIRGLEKQLVELKEANKRLELEAASLKSIQSIEAQARTLNLVPSGGVNYPQESGYAYKK